MVTGRPTAADHKGRNRPRAACRYRLKLTRSCRWMLVDMGRELLSLPDACVESFSRPYCMHTQLLKINHCERLARMAKGEKAMSTKQASLNATLPRCRHCQCYWQPSEGVVASNSYCSSCSESRRSIAEKYLELKPLTQLDRSERYLLPRSLRCT